MDNIWPWCLVCSVLVFWSWVINHKSCSIFLLSSHWDFSSLLVFSRRSCAIRRKFWEVEYINVWIVTSKARQHFSSGECLDLLQCHRHKVLACSVQLSLQLSPQGYLTWSWLFSWGSLRCEPLMGSGFSRGQNNLKNLQMNCCLL